MTAAQLSTFSIQQLTKDVNQLGSFVRGLLVPDLSKLSRKDQVERL
jgi:hypothetical protein